MNGPSPRVAARNEQIVAMALERVQPAEIAQRVGISQASVYQIIRAARAHGAPIPLFQRTRLDGRPPARRYEAKPARAAPSAPERPEVPAAIAVQSAPGVDVHIVELLDRGRRITEIAALLRQPYARVMAIADEQRRRREG